MKGILLAGGSGTRLYPLTRAVSKQLTPIYDKPMVYYPLSTLMLSGIREVMVITTPQDQESFKKLLGDGSEIGLKLQYAAQPRPEGIAQALVIGEKFAEGSPVALVLGDNIFYGNGLQDYLKRAVEKASEGAVVFAYWVKDPERYGVVEFGKDGKPVDLVEKPKTPPSSYAVTGLYFYDGDAPKIAAQLKPSGRGEIEITDLNRAYLKMGKLRVEKFGRGIAWLDTGTPDSLLQASTFIQAIEERQGLKVACLEEIAYGLGYIQASDVKRAASSMKNSHYGEYLLSMLEREG